MSLEETQKELDQFLSLHKKIEVSIDIETLQKRGREMFTSEKGHVIVSIAAAILQAELTEFLKQGTQIDDNIKANMMCRVLVALELQGHININL